MGEEQPAVSEDVGSPLKRVRAGTQQELIMKRAGREAAGEALGLKQPRRSQVQAADETRGQNMANKHPTERELAAAKAARARLYGNTKVKLVIVIQFTAHMCSVATCAMPDHGSESM